MDFDRYRGDSGVWVLYDYRSEGHAYAISIHASQIRSIEALAKMAAGVRLGFWPCDTSIADAVKKWEDRANE